MSDQCVAPNVFPDAMDRMCLALPQCGQMSLVGGPNVMAFLVLIRTKMRIPGEANVHLFVTHEYDGQAAVKQ